MKPSRVAIAAFALGCSGPSEHMNPHIEPEPPVTGVAHAVPEGAGACVEEGAMIAAPASAEDAGTGPQAQAECCPGLTRVGSFKGSILRLDECEPDPDGPAFCVRCGDGKCRVGENMCTCAADCSWP